jgi:hypothetical protein
VPAAVLVHSCSSVVLPIWDAMRSADRQSTAGGAGLSAPGPPAMTWENKDLVLVITCPGSRGSRRSRTQRGPCGAGIVALGLSAVLLIVGGLIAAAAPDAWTGRRLGFQAEPLLRDGLHSCSTFRLPLLSALSSGTSPWRRVTPTDAHNDGQMTVGGSWRLCNRSVKDGLTCSFVEPPYGIEP